MTPEEEFLAHFGVKGMKWGVRKSATPGVSRSTDREARKDAQESARAKLYYGNGAGTRRKLINNTVADKSKRDPAYAKAFENHLSKQNLADHAAGARKERSRTDRKEKTKQRAGFVARKFTGEMGTQAAFTAVALGGAAFLASPKGRSMMKSAATTAKIYAKSGNGRKAERIVSDFFARNS